MLLFPNDAATLAPLAQATVMLLLWLYVALFAQSYAKIALVQRVRKAGFGAMSYTTWGCPEFPAKEVDKLCIRVKVTECACAVRPGLFFLQETPVENTVIEN